MVSVCDWSDLVAEINISKLFIVWDPSELLFPTLAFMAMYSEVHSLGLLTEMNCVECVHQLSLLISILVGFSSDSVVLCNITPGLLFCPALRYVAFVLWFYASR